MVKCSPAISHLLFYLQILIYSVQAVKNDCFLSTQICFSCFTFFLLFREFGGFIFLAGRPLSRPPLRSCYENCHRMSSLLSCPNHARSAKLFERACVIALLQSSVALRSCWHGEGGRVESRNCLPQNWTICPSCSVLSALMSGGPPGSQEGFSYGLLL